jgi:glycosyltransferase involved in cell wall biosynthesis
VPIVTIGMPVYDGAAYVEKAVVSLLAQTFGDFELLLSDDCSTDETPAICDRFARADSRVRFIRQDSHLGMMRNFQYVLDQSRAPLFMWAAQDDLWDPRFIETTKALLDEDPSAIGAMTAVEVVEGFGDGDTMFREVVRLPNQASSDALTRLLAVTAEGPGAIYGLFRTDTLRTVKVDLPIYGPDRAIVFQLLVRGRIAFADDVLRTQARVGYDVVDSSGRKVPRKSTGPEGYLHTPRPWPMCRIMFDEIMAGELPLFDKLCVGADVALNQWWRTKRNGWLSDSPYRIRRAMTQHQYARAALLATRHVVLSPGAVLRGRD